MRACACASRSRHVHPSPDCARPLARPAAVPSSSDAGHRTRRASCRTRQRLSLATGPTYVTGLKPLAPEANQAPLPLATVHRPLPRPPEASRRLGPLRARPALASRSIPLARPTRSRGFAHPAEPAPQLLHHRPHRPREKHPGRPPPGGHRHALPVPRDAGTGLWTRWTWSASAASRSRATRSACGYTAQDGETYALNLIDTPGTSTLPTRSAARSTPARARSSSWTPRRASRRRRSPTCTWRWAQDLEIIPVLNKVDLPSAQPEIVAQSITDLIGGDPDDVLHVSAKTGVGIEAVLERVVERVPAALWRPRGAASGPHLRLHVRHLSRQHRLRSCQRGHASRKGDPITLYGDRRAKYNAEEIGYLKLGHGGHAKTSCPARWATIIGSVKDVQDTQAWATRSRTRAEAVRTEQLPGYRDVKPMVFSGIYPTDSADFEGPPRCT